ncbi:extracellular solute-binding protein [Streptomyces sp. ME19-01-6]|uniref:extracellular solute-binding protein n=1 Tax=Streptomyces sp. ME19-01-6 TaxID=3028686 RepID=UPI0029B73EE3|nr:extracellular solute-binding protein [Streptomyces sp. ME19-01-6]MDX3230296.1 extracellular solute-binding protein [Streptomyces sp. ME19-01-6]
MAVSRRRLLALGAGAAARLSRTDVGGHVNTKVRTALAGKSLVPDIIAINSDVATYFPNQDVFVNLNYSGAAELKSRCLDWKSNECVTPEGRMIAFPMDTGPTGLFYRADLLQEAGITTDPKELAARAPDWDGFIALGKELRKSQERAVVCLNIRHVWSIRRGRLGTKFMTRGGRYVAGAAGWSATCHVPSVFGTADSGKARPHRTAPTCWRPLVITPYKSGEPSGAPADRPSLPIR